MGPESCSERLGGDACSGLQTVSVPGVDRQLEMRCTACEFDEKSGNVKDVCRVPCRVVVHLVLFARLIFDDIDEDVDCRVGVVRTGAIPQ
jgi:hypothetical protein